MSRLSETRTDLQSDWSRLQARWEVARALWTDEVGNAFERSRWQQWADGVPAFLAALDELDEVLRQASREDR
jgi:uncharacterized protein YukE